MKGLKGDSEKDIGGIKRHCIGRVTKKGERSGKPYNSKIV